MLLYPTFQAAARRLAGKIAVVDGNERIDYSELLERVHALASSLLDDGVAPGDRVVALLENSVEFAVGALATLAIGAVFVPVGALAKPDKLAFILRDTRSVALLTQAQLSFTWRPVLAEATSLRSVRVAGEASVFGVDPRVRAWPARTRIRRTCRSRLEAETTSPF